MIEILLCVYGALALLAAVLYLPKLAQLAGALKKPPRKAAEEKRRIALIIPAKNESATIGALFRSIMRQDYDKRFFDVNVVVEDETDPTVKLAREIGANVFVVRGQTCKGDALDGFFRSLDGRRLSDYDAFAIIDADATLSESYVRELNNALEYDRQIFVTRKHVKNYSGGRRARSITCNCAALTYPIVDELGNLYRARKGVPLNLCGQGLMLRREVIEALGGWRYRSLTEDYELKMDGYLRDFTFFYYPYAVIYTEEVTRHSDSYKRRLRWLTGYSQCDKAYRGAVKDKIKRDGASLAVRFDFLYYKLSIFIFLVATGATAVGGIALTVYYAVRGSALWGRSLLLLVALPLFVLYFLLFLYGLAAFLCYRQAMRRLPLEEKIVTLLAEPFFLLEFVPIYLKSRIRAGKPQEKWEQTKRVTYGEGEENAFDT